METSVFSDHAGGLKTNSNDLLLCVIISRYWITQNKNNSRFLMLWGFLYRKITHFKVCALIHISAIMTYLGHFWAAVMTVCGVVMEGLLLSLMPIWIWPCYGSKLLQLHPHSPNQLHVAPNSWFSLLSLPLTGITLFACTCSCPSSSAEGAWYAVVAADYHGR